MPLLQRYNPQDYDPLAYDAGQDAYSAGPPGGGPPPQVATPPPPVASGGGPDWTEADPGLPGGGAPPGASSSFAPAPPPPVATPAQPPKPKSAADRIAALGPEPDMPSGNWAQRLASAILKLNPRTRAVADEVVHPNASGDIRDWQSKRAALQQDLTMEEKQAQTDANTEYKTSTAATRAQQAKNAAQTEQDRASKNEATQWDSERKLMGADAQDIRSDDPKIAQLQQQGWQIIPNKQNPDYAVAVPPRFTTVTPDMLPYLPGRKEGDIIQYAEHKQAMQDFAKRAQDQNKADVKPPKPQFLGNDRLAIIAAGGDPDDPTLSKDIAQKAIDRVKPEREPRPATASQERVEHERTINKLVNQALSEQTGIAPNDPKRIDYALNNVQNYNNYVNHPIGDFRDEVIDRLNKMKLSGFNLQSAQNRANKGSGAGSWSQRMGRPGGAPPAQPPQAAAPRSSAPGGGGPPPQQTQGPPAPVLNALPPGRHTFRNGQVWEKKADGSTQRIS